jgi:hypothetical protein
MQQLGRNAQESARPNSRSATSLPSPTPRIALEKTDYDTIVHARPVHDGTPHGLVSLLVPAQRRPFREPATLNANLGAVQG